MKLGILGGTFDPVHNGHLRLAIEAAEAFGFERVVMEVARLSPFKSTSFASEDVRLKMVQLAVAGEAVLEVGTRELLRPEPSYSVDTVAEYVAEGNEVWFVVGADAVTDMRAWKEPERLLQLCRVAAADRPGFRFDPGSLPGDWAKRIDRFEMRQMEISSTEIRDRVRAGLSIRGLVPDPVRHFIEEKRLYR